MQECLFPIPFLTPFLYTTQIGLLYSNSGKNDSVESELILDRQRDHYLWLEVDWQNNKYIYAPFIHIDIKDGKIWLQRNFTDVDLGEKLIALGVKKRILF